MGSTMIKLQLINLGRWTTQRWVTKQNFPNDPAETQIGSQKIIPPCDLSEALSTCDENYDVANSSYALMELLSLIIKVICEHSMIRLTLVITQQFERTFQTPRCFKWFGIEQICKTEIKMKIMHNRRACTTIMNGISTSNF